MGDMLPEGYPGLLQEIKGRIRAAQYEALKAVNKELIALYWDIGRMIAERQKDSGWGKSVVEKLATDLQNEFPGMRGFSVQNLWYMRQFYLAYAGHEKLQPLVGEISWAKHLVIMGKCKDDLEREFYIRMTRKFGWTKNVLVHQVENRTYEKTLLSQTTFDRAVAAETAYMPNWLSKTNTPLIFWRSTKNTANGSWSVVLSAVSNIFFARWVGSLHLWGVNIGSKWRGRSFS